jgi:hypothetical protein
LNEAKGQFMTASCLKKRILNTIAVCIFFAFFSSVFISIATLGQSLADADADGRVAIIHTSTSTIIDNKGNARGNILQQLRDMGVRIVGRYFARCRQGSQGGELWTKPIVHGGASPSKEADAILSAQFAILSIYQYWSGDVTGPKKFTIGLREKENNGCEVTEASDRIKISMSASDEGQLDAQAAVKQAHAIGQPAGTAIYFGVDFNFNKADRAQVSGVLEYFRRVREELTKDKNRFLVGGYGNGDILSLLLGDNDTKEVLIDFAWLSTSASYAGTSRFHNSGRWHIAHAQSDNHVGFTRFGNCFDFEYDTDIQNKASFAEYVGAWNRLGRYLMPAVRTAIIYDQRRFICNIKGVVPGSIRRACGEAPIARQCSLSSCFARIVRLKPTQDFRAPTEKDFDLRDYGTFDGRTSATNLTRSLDVKPLWWTDKDRRSQLCTCYGSDENRPCE